MQKRGGGRQWHSTEALELHVFFSRFQSGPDGFQ
jgi:hypothetical protein